MNSYFNPSYSPKNATENVQIGLSYPNNQDDMLEHDFLPKFQSDDSTPLLSIPSLDRASSITPPEEFMSVQTIPMTMAEISSSSSAAPAISSAMHSATSMSMESSSASSMPAPQFLYLTQSESFVPSSSATTTNRITANQIEINRANKKRKNIDQELIIKLAEQKRQTKDAKEKAARTNQASNEMMAQLILAQSQSAQLTREISELKAQNIRLLEERLPFLKDHAALTKENIKLMSQLTSLQNENRLLNDEKHSQQENTTRLQNQNTSSKKENETLSERNASLMIQVSELTDQLTAHKAENKHLKKEMAKPQRNLQETNRLIAENLSQRQQIAQLQEQTKQMDMALKNIQMQERLATQRHALTHFEIQAIRQANTYAGYPRLLFVAPPPPPQHPPVALTSASSNAQPQGLTPTQAKTTMR
jgi:hypothetical protein